MGGWMKRWMMKGKERCQREQDWYFNVQRRGSWQALSCCGNNISCKWISEFWTDLFKQPHGWSFLTLRVLLWGLDVVPEESKRADDTNFFAVTFCLLLTVSIFSVPALLQFDGKSTCDWKSFCMKKQRSLSGLSSTLQIHNSFLIGHCDRFRC